MASPWLLWVLTDFSGQIIIVISAGGLKAPTSRYFNDLRTDWLIHTFQIGWNHHTVVLICRFFRSTGDTADTAKHDSSTKEPETGSATKNAPSYPRFVWCCRGIFERRFLGECAEDYWFCLYLSLCFLVADLVLKKDLWCSMNLISWVNKNTTQFIEDRQNPFWESLVNQLCHVQPLVLPCLRLGNITIINQDTKSGGRWWLDEWRSKRGIIRDLFRSMSVWILKGEGLPPWG